MILQVPTLTEYLSQKLVYICVYYKWEPIALIQTVGQTAGRVLVRIVVQKIMEAYEAGSSEAMDVDQQPVQTNGEISAPAQRGPRASSVPIKHPDYTVGYVYSTEMMAHFSPQGHPERPARIDRIWNTLQNDQLTQKMKWLPIRPVRKEEALLVHSDDHWDKVIAIQCALFRLSLFF
jgi:hypothetical protein